MSQGYNIHERVQNRFVVDQKAALFGSRGGGGAQQRPNAQNNDRNAAASREMLEKQNDAMIADLEGKTSMLASLAGDMGKQIGSSNALLDKFGIDMDRAGGLLKGTMSKLKTMMNNGSGSHMCKMMIFVFVLFFFMYVLRKIPFIGGRSTPSLEAVTLPPTDGTSYTSLTG